MTTAGKIATFLADDDLAGATQQARELVKASPSDKSARHLYIDLLILAGDYEKADAQCNVASTLSPDDAVGFALLRNELRGMAARRAWFETGAVPDFPGGPTDTDKAALALGIIHREGGEAASALAALEDARGEHALYWNDRQVSDFRDLDDRTAHALEAITSGGSYMWIDFARIASVKIEPITRPRDFAFPHAQLTLLDGASASVMLPAVYEGTVDDPKLLLGRGTDWVDESTGITTGRGQRCFLAGDALVAIHETTVIGTQPLKQETNADG